MTLASSPPVPIETGVDMTGVWLGIGGLLVLAIIGALLIHAVRRHFNRQDDDVDGGFSLHDLRQLRDTRKLTDDEYVHMRNLLLGTRGKPAPAAEATSPTEAHDVRKQA